MTMAVLMVHFRRHKKSLNLYLTPSQLELIVRKRPVISKLNMLDILSILFETLYISFVENVLSFYKKIFEDIL